MGLFKKMTDPSPGGGLTGDDPEAEKRRNANDMAREMARDQVRLSDGSSASAASTEARIVDSTELIMGGVRAAGKIDAIRPAAKEINLQPTFDVKLTVFAEDGEFSAHVIQPVAEEYVAAATAGADLAVKYDADDRGAVWIDWAASAAG